MSETHCSVVALQERGQPSPGEECTPGFGALDVLFVQCNAPGYQERLFAADGSDNLKAIMPVYSLMTRR